MPTYTTTKKQTTCFHCGENCTNTALKVEDKNFCCQGCKTVYEIIHQTGMCNYYTLHASPGATQKQKIRENKFAFLTDAEIASKLISFKNSTETHITFYLPHIHCSSCLWLLENLPKINSAILSSKVNFARKEVDIIFSHTQISLENTADLLASIGYEPYISLQNLTRNGNTYNNAKLYKLGVAGFCFANIMLLSFPEYLGIDEKEILLANVFRYLNVILSIPVFFYSGSEFYISAWKGLQHKFLNIDAPIVLAIIITYFRSLYEVFTGIGGGYFDSMSGIIFLMLAGRVLQEKTYEQLNFDRDYTSYFPIAISKMVNGKKTVVSLPNVQLNDTLRIHQDELIPADGIITRGKALIDYSFVTGESTPIQKEMGEIVYAGGRQMDGDIEVLVIKEVAQSYLTKLWNNQADKTSKPSEQHTFVHLLSKYFTWVVLAIAFMAAVYWQFYNPSLILPSVTAVLIVACPCALLLSNTFTNGNILRIFGNNKLYLRNAQTIEALANITTIVFDKTGTLTTNQHAVVEYNGTPLTQYEKQLVASLAAQSNHTLSRALCSYIGYPSELPVLAFKNHVGLGIEGFVDETLVAIGSKEFLMLQNTTIDNTTQVYVAIEGRVKGKFSVGNQYRENLPKVLTTLSTKYQLAVLSGDNNGEQPYLETIIGRNAPLLFNLKPTEKLSLVKQMQQQGKNVLMIGDGLNDAGALQQAQVGIAVAENTNTFTPASDAIIDANSLAKIEQFLLLSKWNKRIVLAAFTTSLLYNIIGIVYAVQGQLSPMIAAILMPASSITIVALTYGASGIVARYLGLKNYE